MTRRENSFYIIISSINIIYDAMIIFKVSQREIYMSINNIPTRIQMLSETLYLIYCTILR